MRVIIFISILLVVFVSVANGQQEEELLQIEGTVDKETYDKFKELNIGLYEFEQKMLQQNKYIDSLRNKVNTDEFNSEELEIHQRKITEAKKMIEAYTDGVIDIRNQLSIIKDDIEQKKKNNNKKKDDEKNTIDKYNDKIKNSFISSLSGVDIGLNNVINKNRDIGFADSDNNMRINSSKSWNVAFYFKSFSIPIVMDYVYVGSRMGLEWNNYNFINNITLAKSAENNLVSINADSNPEFRKNTLNTVFFNVPVVFDVNVPTRQNSNLVIAAGIVGGAKLSAKTKQIYNTSEGTKRKIKESGDYLLSPFRYGFIFRIGLNNFHLYANYSMTPLFIKDKGPLVHPFSLGVFLGL